MTEGGLVVPPDRCFAGPSHRQVNSSLILRHWGHREGGASSLCCLGCIKPKPRILGFKSFWNRHPLLLLLLCAAKKSMGSHRDLWITKIIYLFSLYNSQIKMWLPLTHYLAGWPVRFEDGEYHSVLILLFPLVATDITIVAVISDHLFSLVWYMRTHGGDPFEGRRRPSPFSHP